MLTVNIASVGVVTVLAFQQVDAESGIILARIDRDDVHDRFVTWRLFDSPEHGKVAISGRYFSRLLQASFDFEVRTKNYTVVESAVA